MAACSGVPKSVITASTSVSTRRTSASRASGEDRAGEVLVDDCLDPPELSAVVADHRDSAAAGTHDHGAALQEQPDESRLHDALGARGTRPPGASPCHLPSLPSPVGGEALGLLPRVDLSHDLVGSRAPGARVDEYWLMMDATCRPGRLVLQRPGAASTRSSPWVCAPRTSNGYGVLSCGSDALCSASTPTCGPFPCVSTSSCSSARGASAATARATFAACTYRVGLLPRA
jgi:hypothetical protein